MPIIAGVGVLVVAIVGYYFLTGNQGPKGSFAAVGPLYACDTLLTPGPSDTLPPPLPSITAAPATPSSAPSTSPSGEAGGSAAPSASAASSSSAAPSASAAPSTAASPTAPPTPAPAPTLRLGFTTQVLGRNHITNPAQTIEYGFCPPTSGDHYNIAGVGPIPAAVYPNNTPKAPGGWVHNLEHGWVVVLYRCTGPSDCPSDAEMQQLQAWYDQAPTPDPSQGCTIPKEVLVARFDSMTTRFAELAWGRALLSNDFTLDTALTFAQQWMDPGSEPEKTIC